MSDIRVTALYKFVAFEDPEALREPLFAQLSELGIKGTILLATEGVNGTIAGTPDAMDKALDTLWALPGCETLEWKDSHAEAMPFLRLKVRLKNEIVTMGVPGTNPTCLVGSYVKPQDWNALISDPDTVVIDTRGQQGRWLSGEREDGRGERRGFVAVGNDDQGRSGGAFAGGEIACWASREAATRL